MTQDTILLPGDESARAATSEERPARPRRAPRAHRAARVLRTDSRRGRS